MDLAERLNTVHRDMFCSMLRMKEHQLPEKLLIKYVDIKTLTDRIDGRISPCDLARMALDCGYDTVTGTFISDPQPVVVENIQAAIEPKPVIPNPPPVIPEGVRPGKIDIEKEGILTPGTEVRVFDGQQLYEDAYIAGVNDGKTYTVRLDDGSEKEFDVDQIEVAD